MYCYYADVNPDGTYAIPAHGLVSNVYAVFDTPDINRRVVDITTPQLSEAANRLYLRPEAYCASGSASFPTSSSSPATLTFLIPDGALKLFVKYYLP